MVLPVRCICTPLTIIGPCNLCVRMVMPLLKCSRCVSRGIVCTDLGGIVDVITTCDVSVCDLIGRTSQYVGVVGRTLYTV